MKKLSVFLCVLFLMFGIAGMAAAVPLNPGFETGDLTNWTYGGQAGVQGSVVHQGSYSAWVGTVDYIWDNSNDFTGQGGDWVYNNYITQTIDVEGMESLDVWYNFFTWDYQPYDTPGFEIQVNYGGASYGQFSIAAGDVGDGFSLASTGWSLYSFDMGSLPNEAQSLDLIIYAGNTIDTGYQSWAYIDVDYTPTGGEPVPEPATMLLLGSGLASLAGLRRKFRKS
jgi:hypothetical protein